MGARRMNSQANTPNAAATVSSPAPRWRGESSRKSAAAVIAPAHAADKLAQYTISVEPGSVLNFRAAPSTDAEILYQLGPGNTVTVHETSGDWALVTWTVLEPLDDPRAAWVCMKYLQPVEEATSN